MFSQVTEKSGNDNNAMTSTANVSLDTGIEVIKKAAKKLPDSPGVYRMLDEKGVVLYVGKAKSLNKRVLSYTRVNKLPVRLQRMVGLTKSMEFVYTNTEVEALLLESNLIKKHRPQFNVLLKDDKSFPYIYISTDKDFPQILKHRGAKSKKGEYFGPFTSGSAVNRTLNSLQRAFMLRNCTDSYFKARKRPCLQYHIKRCTAPCVGYVNQDQYDEQVAGVLEFLSGKSHDIQQKLAYKMQQASEDMEYELAARYRDRIRALSSIQSKQVINIQNIRDADIIGLVQDGGITCVQVFFFRGGQNFGNRPFFPKHDSQTPPDEIMSAFLAQFYEDKPVPKEVLVSHSPLDNDLLVEALEQKAGTKVSVRRPQRGEGREVMEFALRNAQDALKRHLAERVSQKKVLIKVQELFGLDSPPERIEVYDNSHISGDNMVGAMIVATPDGFQKNAYRKFNIKSADKSDDYGMMREVIKRRFQRALGNDTAAGENWPDLILIDGGKGQLSSVLETLQELNIHYNVNVAAISKGPDRHAGREVIHFPDKTPVSLKKNNAALHYLQRLRDEAHRFAIGAHRARREKQLSRSSLDDIPGIGAKRKKALLHYFGSAREVERAALEDLQNVDGISETVAQKIYDYFHEAG